MRNRPPYALDEEHPLTEGLMAAFIPAPPHDNFSIYHNLVSGGPHMEDTDTAKPFFDHSQYNPGGYHFNLSVDDRGIFTTMPPAWKVNPPCTLLAGVLSQATTGDVNAGVFGGYYSNPQGAPWVSNLLAISGASEIGMFSNDGTLITTPAGNGMPVAAMTVNTLHIIVGIFGVSVQEIFRDGVSVAAASVADTSTAYSSTAALVFGEVDVGARRPRCRVTHGLMWDRALTDTEIGLVSVPSTELPLLQAARRRVYVDLLAAAAQAPYQPWSQRAPILAQ